MSPFAFPHLSWPDAAACRDLLLYLSPSLVLAIVFHFAARRAPVFFVFYLSGTILHELAHFLVGVLTNARPVAFSVVPRRTAADQWRLGQVSFANIRWYNAAFVGLAPLLILAVPLLAGWYRMDAAGMPGWEDAAIAVLIAPAFLSFMPSTVDLLIALRSWPYALAGATYAWWTWH